MSTDPRELDLTGIARRSLTRRDVIKLGVGVAGTAAILPLIAACADDDVADDTVDEPAAPDTDDETDDEEPVDEPDDDTDDETPADPTAGGELIYGLSADPPNLDPHHDTGAAASVPKQLVYSNLWRHWVDNDEYELQPDLATDVDISDDGLTYTFSLREGVTFHDGSTFTSADVAATFDRILDDGVGATNHGRFSNITDIDASDDHTVVMSLSAPNSPMLTDLANSSSLIMSSEFIERDGDPNAEMIGTGPFMFDADQYEPGVRIVLLKFDGYFHEGYPLLDQVTLIPYPDEDTRIAAALAGDVHIAEYTEWRDYERVREHADVHLASGDAAAFMDVIYNCAEEPFDDPAVRYALGFAFNRQAVVDIAFFGEGSPITGGFIQEGIFGHNPDLEGTFDYDPDRAQELLAEAGYPDGFSCTLMSTSQYGMHQGTAEVVQENLQDIGVDCELQLFDWSTVVERWEQAEYQFRIHGRGTGEGDPDVLSLIYHSTRPAALRANCSYPEVDDLLDRAREIVDPDEREPLYHEVQELLLELSITSLLTTRVQSETVRNNVHGYEHYPGGLFSTSCQSIEKVWIEDE